MFEVSAEDAVTIMANDEALLVDVREGYEWEAGHVPGALHMPLNEVNQRYRELPDDAPVLVICHTGGRSAMVAQALERAGYEVANVAGGMESWQAAGGVVLRSDGSTGIVV